MKKFGFGCLIFFIIDLMIFIIIIGILFFGFSNYSDKILRSLGKPLSQEVYTDGDFQDFTDYGIYRYDNIDFYSNKHFKPITEDDKKEILTYIDNFEGWIDSIKNITPEAEIVVHYKFDRSIIDENDYFYIDDKSNYEELYKDHKYANYDVYFFDVDQQILYFFHNNI